MAEKAKAGGKPTASASPAAKGKVPSLNFELLKSDDGLQVTGINVFIKNGGLPSRLFLVNNEGNLVKVVESKDFKATWDNPSIARSKRSLSDEKTQYLSTRASMTPQQMKDKTQFEAMVKREFTAIKSLVEGGLLHTKRAKKRELIVVSLA